ncbi:MAG: 4Fe-4S dicluster domain-containing protein [Candidatus Thiodiazotropha sp.]
MKHFLDWSAYRDAGMGDAYADIPRTGGDFAKAVAVCINSRRCESLDKGVMCPSYRLDGDPDLSTGARVRLLKAALNGEMGPQGLLDPRLVEAMDLCVSCKGCKRECENNVDMAQIKIEYLAQLNASTGLSLRARLLGGLPRWLAHLPWLKGLIRLRNRHAWLARLGETLLGLSARRRLPQPASQPFPDESRTAEGERTVILFVDTFTRHFEPEIAEAALSVLEAAGYRVNLVQAAAGDTEQRPLCCGRSYLSQGMVEPAKREARRTLDALLPHAEAGVPIIGLEPSCLLTLRDEYLTLGLGEAAERVAKQALLFEEFLARERSAGRLALPLQRPMDGAKKILVHGHCHQKAVGAMKSMRKVLKLIPDLAFEMVDASCCGMAGSFGLEAEHAAHSLAMAEQALLPALRAEPAAQVVANGFSCRQQIADGVQCKPLHLALLLQSALIPGPPVRS